MRITEIRYERKLSDGNYGSEGISITGSAGAAEGIDPMVAGPALKIIVEHQLHGDRWLREYTQAMRIVVGEIQPDDESEIAAREYVVGYDVWYARVQEARRYLGLAVDNVNGMK